MTAGPSINQIDPALMKTLEPGEFLHEQLAQASPDLMRELLATFVNSLLGAEADAVCGAAYGSRAPERVNSRNGYRHRDLDTRVGTIDVAIPKLRAGTYFPEWLLERRRRAEAALTQRGRDLLPPRRQHPADGQARAVAGDHRALEVPGQRDGRRSRRARRRLPHPPR